MLCGYYAFESGNTEYARSNLILLSKDKRSDGLLSICSPCGIDLTIPSFSLYYFIAVGEYLNYTKDATLIDEIYTKLISLTETFVGNMHNGLVYKFTDENHWNFYDWSEYLEGKLFAEEEYKPDLIINCLFVYKLDRFSRNKYEMAMHKKTLRDNGVKLLSAMENIPDTPEGIILESLLEGMAEYYSAKLSQKVLRGMRETRLKGNYTGGRILYGYKVVNKKVVIDEHEAEVVRYIYAQYAAGVFVKDIITSLTEKGVLYHGAPFKKNTVHNMLNNERYHGVLRHNGEAFTNIFPAIVPDDVFEIVKRKSEENRYGKHDSPEEYLLKFKVFCGLCGKSMTSDSGTSKSGAVMRYYKCFTRKSGGNCGKTPIRKDVLEQIVVDTTLNVFCDTTKVFDLAEKIIQRHEKRLAENSVLHILERERQETQRAIDNIMDAMEKGIVTSSTKSRLTKLEGRLDEIEAKIIKENAKEKASMKREDIIRYIRAAIKKNPKQMIRELVKKVVLYDDKIQIYYNYTDNKRTEKGTDGEIADQSLCFYKGEKIFNVKMYKYCSFLCCLELYI